MTKISLALASMLVLSSASSNVAFAAMSNAQALVQGQDIDKCRAEEEPDANMKEKHAHLAREACVQRLEHVNQSTNW